MIDSTAFLLYGHWIKKKENQNRATLFQTEEKCDLVRHEQRLLDPSDPRTRRFSRQTGFDDAQSSIINRS